MDRICILGVLFGVLPLLYIMEMFYTYLSPPDCMHFLGVLLDEFLNLLREGIRKHGR